MKYILLSATLLSLTGCKGTHVASIQYGDNVISKLSYSSGFGTWDSLFLAHKVEDTNNVRMIGMQSTTGPVGTIFGGVVDGS